MAQFRAMGIVSGPSRHPKDVLFVSEFWWGTYGLGAISPRKQQISAKFHISNLQNYKFQRHSPGVATLSSSLYCSVSSRFIPTRIVLFCNCFLLTLFPQPTLLCNSQRNKATVTETLLTSGVQSSDWPGISSPKWSV